MNGDRFFLDTNVFVYCFDTAATAKREQADQLVESALVSRRGAVSAQVVQEFCSVMLGKRRQGPRPPELDFYVDATFGPLLVAAPRWGWFTMA